MKIPGLNTKFHQIVANPHDTLPGQIVAIGDPIPLSRVASQIFENQFSTEDEPICHYLPSKYYLQMLKENRISLGRVDKFENDLTEICTGS